MNTPNLNLSHFALHKLTLNPIHLILSPPKTFTPIPVIYDGSILTSDKLTLTSDVFQSFHTLRVF